MKPDQIKQVFTDQQEALKNSGNSSVQHRINQLIRIREWLEGNRLAVQQAIFNDFSKPPAEVDLTETYVVLSEIKHAIKNIDQWVKPRKVNAPVALIGSSSQILYEPKGVCLIIAPWNFPFNLTLGPLVSALAAGNTAILKPSELTPNCSNLIQRLVTDLFEPTEVAVVNGGVEVSQQLLDLPFDHIFFTGSPRVGKIIMEKASRHLTSVTLELGGKSPALVDATANLEDTAEKIVWGKFLNCGQTCIAPDYILVDESVEEDLLEHMIGFVDKFFDPEGEGIPSSKSYGRVISTRHLEKLQSLLSEAVETNAYVECGGDINKDDLFFAPTIVSRVSLEMDLMKEEIFGPILPVLTFKTMQEAIGIINDFHKPLALYLFTTSTKNKKQVLEQTSSGTVAENDCMVQFMNPHLPFGGVSTSGLGRSHGFAGFQTFSNQRSMLSQKTGITSVKPLYPPYTVLTKKAIDLLLKYL